MRTIICSHGFGVGADSRGMFPEIAAALPQFKFVMFDYNTFDMHRNATVVSLQKQAEKLNEQIAGAEQPITLLCHSQGCIVASLAELSAVDKLVFLAPPDELTPERFIRIFAGRKGAVYNPEGVSSIPRSDGTTTYLGKDYMDSVAHTDVQQLFKAVANKKPVTIVRAADDEIVGETRFPAVPADIITIPGNHNFTATRAELIETLGHLLD